MATGALRKSSSLRDSRNAQLGRAAQFAGRALAGKLQTVSGHVADHEAIVASDWMRETV
jgi:hypothetical protein